MGRAKPHATLALGLSVFVGRSPRPLFSPEPGFGHVAESSSLRLLHEQVIPSLTGVVVQKSQTQRQRTALPPTSPTPNSLCELLASEPQLPHL